MRKLASVQKIKDIRPMDADRLELALVLGWKSVVPKNQFRPGDLCVYFEVDSFLPIEERYAFLEKSCKRNNEFMGQGYKIFTQKLRGELSQGLILPLSVFPEITELYQKEDTDVTELLKVRKWEIPEVTGNAGTAIGNKPFGIPTTDEMRVQSNDMLRESLLGKPYYISTKMDGTSCTIYYIDGKFGVCGRTEEYKDDGKSAMWEYVKKHSVEEKLRNLGFNIVLQGEFCGPKIQKNRIGLDHYELYIFNVLNPDSMNQLPIKGLLYTCNQLGLNTVPIEEVGEKFNYTADELLERAKGNYPSGNPKEGIVIRPLIPEHSKILGKELSFKVLNNDFLLKDK